MLNVMRQIKKPTPIIRCFFLSLFFCFFSFQVQGKSWRVERDGSGDFAVIQDGVDASASGDTILIGPGRYNEWQMYGGNTQYPARVIIGDKDLALIGESDGSTVIGPSEPWEPGTQHQGIVLISESSVIVRNLTIENLFGGVMSWSGGGFKTADCTFQDNMYALYYQEGSGLIENCAITSSVAGTLHVFSNYQNGFVIRNCTVEQVDHFEHANRGIVVQGCPNALIKSCLVSGTRAGVQFDFNTTALVSNSQIRDNPQGPAVSVGPGECSVHLVDCSISNSQVGFDSIEEGSTFMVESTVITDMELAVLRCNNLNQGYFRNCNLVPGERGVVLYYPHWKSDGKSASLVHDFDMRENFWNTDNPDSIQVWIEDNSDDPSINYRILWEPFSGEFVSSKPSSMGSVKALFR